MSAPKPTMLQHRFTRAFTSGDVGRQVSIVQPIARELILTGIDDDSFCVTLERIAGSRETVGDWDQFCRHTSAAHALGIAVGLLLRPDAIGGAR